MQIEVGIAQQNKYSAWFAQQLIASAHRGRSRVFMSDLIGTVVA